MSKAKLVNPKPNFRALGERFIPATLARLLRRGLLWKRETQFRPYIVTRLVQDEAIPFYICDATGELWYGTINDVSPELPFLRDRMISEDDLIFDIGAHHGFYAVYMARRAKRLIAIEPNPHNVAILQKNVALNRLQNVIVRQAAVGDSVGHVELLRNSNSGGIRSSETTKLPAFRVELLTLDHLAREHGFPQMLKIDVEGFEASVLRGASQIMAHRPKIVIEVHVDWVTRYGSSVREVLDLLHLENYCVWMMHHQSLEIKRWIGEDLTTVPPPKFHLFLLPSYPGAL